MLRSVPRLSALLLLHQFSSTVILVSYNHWFDKSEEIETLIRMQGPIADLIVRKAYVAAYDRIAKSHWWIKSQR